MLGGQRQPGPAFKANNGTLPGQRMKAPLNLQVLLKTCRGVGEEWGGNFISLSFLPFLIFAVSENEGMKTKLIENRVQMPMSKLFRMALSPGHLASHLRSMMTWAWLQLLKGSLCCDQMPMHAEVLTPVVSLGHKLG